MSLDVLVMGSASLDIRVRAPCKTLDGHLAYPLGGKLLMDRCVVRPGGAGLNACGSFSALGLRCGFVGQLGDDIYSQPLMDWMRAQGVVFLGHQGGASGISVALEGETDRVVLTHKGANDHLGDEGLWDAVCARMPIGWMHATTLLGTSLTTQIQLCEQFRRTGGRIAYNPNLNLCTQPPAVWRPLLSCAQVLVVNRQELQALAGHGSTLEQARHIATYGPQVVAVSDGPQGVWVLAGQNPWGVAGAWHIVPRTFKVHETTGAGDAFGAGLVAGLIANLPSPQAALAGVLNAEAVLQAQSHTQFCPPDPAQIWGPIQDHTALARIQPWHV